MNDPKITLELTPEEVLLLQELTKNMQPGYLWMHKIGETLKEKVFKAYRKPSMSRKKYLDRLDKVKELFGTEELITYMLHAEKAELRFLYQIEGEEE